MKPIHRRRLLKLARHLERGKLGHKKFDFGAWNLGRHVMDEPPRERCWYAGCAIGECPIAFPVEWAFVSDDWSNPQPCLRTASQDWYNNPLFSARRFFGLSKAAACHLFIPAQQRPELYGGQILGGTAKRTTVAKGIRSFLKVKAAK